jgi:hypothetical protein
MSQPVAQVGKKGEIERFTVASFVAALGQLAWFLAYFVPTLAITIAALGPSIACSSASWEGTGSIDPEADSAVAPWPA